VAIVLILESVDEGCHFRASVPVRLLAVDVSRVDYSHNGYTDL